MPSLTWASLTCSLNGHLALLGAVAILGAGKGRLGIASDGLDRSRKERAICGCGLGLGVIEDIDLFGFLRRSRRT